MNNKKEILEKNAKEYFYSGEDNLKNDRYNSSVVLFFKALISLVDIYILDKMGITPSSHTNRFKIIQENFPEVYNLVDKDFPFYQDIYSQSMNKEIAGVIKDDAKTMAKKTEIKL